MASLEDFLKRLDENALDALSAYKFLVDEPSLDYVQGMLEKVRGEFDQVYVTLDYHKDTITLRGVAEGEAAQEGMIIWYLPWKQFDGENDNSGLAMATLDGTGPAIFLTSQLNGCRFTIQYHSGSMTKATVLHLAGNYGQDKDGGLKREAVETAALQGVPGVDFRRRLSIGQYSKANTWGKLPQARSYYDGDKATILGVRGADQKWQFYAQQYTWDLKPIQSTASKPFVKPI